MNYFFKELGFLMVPVIQDIRHTCMDYYLTIESYNYVKGQLFKYFGTEFTKLQ